jgi:hypothetical protein
MRSISMLPGAAARAPTKQDRNGCPRRARSSSPRAWPLQARHSKSNSPAAARQRRRHPTHLTFPTAREDDEAGRRAERALSVKHQLFPVARQRIQHPCERSLRTQPAAPRREPRTNDGRRRVGFAARLWRVRRGAALTFSSIPCRTPEAGRRTPATKQGGPPLVQPRARTGASRACGVKGQHGE